MENRVMQFFNSRALMNFCCLNLFSFYAKSASAYCVIILIYIACYYCNITNEHHSWILFRSQYVLAQSSFPFQGFVQLYFCFVRPPAANSTETHTRLTSNQVQLSDKNSSFYLLPRDVFWSLNIYLVVDKCRVLLHLKKKLRNWLQWVLKG